MPAPSLLFVCLGNICRSPLAEGVYRHLAEADSGKRVIASAGLGAWHVGNPPDGRSIAVARRNGVDISRQRARQIETRDFFGFDWILAMDRSNLVQLQALTPQGATATLALFSQAAHGITKDIPDPYYGGEADFETVYSMVFSGCSALFEKLEVPPPS